MTATYYMSYRFSSTGLLFRLAFALIVLSAVQTSFAEITFVSSGPPQPQPEIRFARLPDEAGIRLNIVPPEGIGDEFSPDVTIISLPKDLALSHQIDSLSYRLEGDSGTAVEVRVSSTDAGNRGTGATRDFVFIGDFVAAVDRLRERFSTISMVPTGDSSLAERLRGEFVAWLGYWLEGMEPSSTAELGDGITSGESVRWFWQATQYMDWLENAEDIVAQSRGHQLPARHVFKARVGSDVREIAFNYLIRLPSGSQESEWPFLGFVHGLTPAPTLDSARRDEIEIAAAKMDFPFLTAALAFNGDMRQQGGWNPGEVTAFMSSLARLFLVDQDRIYLTGFSMGGYGTYNAVTLRPDLFAACGILCGYGDPAWAETLASLPVYLYHGDQDDAVSCFRSLNTYEGLMKTGSNPEFYIYEGMGHPVWSEVYKDPAFYQRLLRHQRLDLATRQSRIRTVSPLQSPSLEFKDLSPLDLSSVLWLDNPGLTIGEFLSDEDSELGASIKRVELLYPRIPIRGNILMVLPEGLAGPESPVKIGIPVEAQNEWPETGFLDSLKTTGPSAVYRGAPDGTSLSSMAKVFAACQSADSDPETATYLLLEIESYEIHAGSRLNFRNITKVPAK